MITFYNLHLPCYQCGHRFLPLGHGQWQCDTCHNTVTLRFFPQPTCPTCKQPVRFQLQGHTAYQICKCHPEETRYVY